MHLLALSGLHVAWLAAVARVACAAVGGGPVARAWTGAACAALYALFAGPIPSLLRAVASEGYAALARVTKRGADPAQSLAVGALVLLALRPGWAHDLGFQLSCAATLGLVTLSAPFAEPFARRAWLRPVAAALATTAAAQLLALPVLLARFHALPWTGLAANLAAVPLSELLLAAAWAGGALEALAPGLGGPWLSACEPLARGIAWVAARAAEWPGALLASGSDPAAAWLAAVGAALLALALPPPRALAARLHALRRPRAERAVLAWTGAATCATALVAALAARPLAPPPGTWWLVVLDVGQGDALAIAAARGWWLVDSGPRTPRWDAGEGTVLPFLRAVGVRRLERLVLTHDDGDHAGGARAVLRGAPPAELDAAAPRPGVRGPLARFAGRRRTFALGRGDTLQGVPPALVLWPPRPGEPGDTLAARGDNAASVVLVVGEGAGRALLTGDADSLVEAALAVTPPVAVLKAGHHGSGSSSGAAFVARARPAAVAVSAGRRNAYGHPHPRALERLRSRGARVDRTDREGTLWYALDAHGARRLDWRAGEPWARPRPVWRAAPAPRP
ncbi:MAG: DNA internalization-related competence protein ComEC/Rec2 [Candidatus Eisenbacteria bacterium]